MATLTRNLNLAWRGLLLAVGGRPAEGARARLLEQVLAGQDRARIEARVERCCLVKEPFALGEGVRVGEFRDLERTSYFVDLMELLRWFPETARFAHEFGDGLSVPAVPTLRKARRLGGGEEKTVLLRLNSVRHFQFVKDVVPFRRKRARVVWRGAVNRPWREALVRLHDRDPRFDIGQTKGRHQAGPWCKDRLSVREQLGNKFVISVEGNDVATNLKWILASNSLCVMPRPKIESWFLEGWLQPGVHYALVQDDFCDLQAVIDRYSDCPDEAEAIIARANAHAKEFMDPRRELALGLLVLERYFSLALP